jgi:hypothetical protein
MSKSTISTFELFQMFPDAEAARVYMEGYTVQADALGDHTDADVIRAAQETAPVGYWLQHVEAIGGDPHRRDVFKKAVPWSLNKTPNALAWGGGHLARTRGPPSEAAHDREAGASDGRTGEVRDAWRVDLGPVHGQRLDRGCRASTRVPVHRD